jgi:hypothetical protein
MFKIVGRRVGLVLMAVVILSALVVPAASAGTQAGPTERTSGSQLNANAAGGYGCSKTIIVRKGDNLTKIAYRYGTTVNALLRCNNIWNPDKIYWGQRLCICYPYAPKPYPKPQPPPKPKPQPCPQPCMQGCPQGCPRDDERDDGRDEWRQPPPPMPQPKPGQRPCCTDSRSVINSPGQNARVRDSVPIFGTAVHQDFDFYKLEFGAGSNPNTWTWFAGGDVQVRNGFLGTFQAGVLAPGTYTIRLTVVDKTGNYPTPCQVTVIVCW